MQLYKEHSFTDPEQEVLIFVYPSQKEVFSVKSNKQKYNPGEIVSLKIDFLNDDQYSLQEKKMLFIV